MHWRILIHGVIAPVIISVFGLTAACNLPSIPADFEETEPREIVDSGPTVCEPSSAICLGNAVQRCSDDGLESSVEACQSVETCLDGACVALENTCEKGQPFGISATELQFSIDEDYAGEVQSITLDNCGVRTVFVDQIALRGPTRADGAPVFSRSETTPARFTLEPGETFEIGVEYAPSEDLSVVRGTLELGVITTEYNRYTIPLRTRSECVSVTPDIVWNPSSDGNDTRVAWLQNCGTDPIVVEDVEAESHFEPLEKLPFELSPGDHLGVEVWMPDTPGAFDSSVDFLTDTGSLSTRVRGHRTAGECDDSLDGVELAAAVNNLPVALGDGLLEVEPRDRVRLIAPDLPQGWISDYWPIFTPSAYTAPLKRRESETLVSPGATGLYAYELVAINAEGQRACDVPVIEIDAWPRSGVWVELTWQNFVDRISADTDFATGVRLDLHVLRRDASAAWNGPSDCVPARGDGCDQAKIIQSNQTGAAPESVFFEEVPDTPMDIGVYLLNPFNFEGARATIRVWRSGRLLDERTALLTNTNDFWWVGRLDPFVDEFSVIDSVFDNFPR